MTIASQKVMRHRPMKNKIKSTEQLIVTKQKHIEDYS